MHLYNIYQVPAAIKSLYSHPLPDTCGVPSMCDSVLTADEDAEKWRREEEERGKPFVVPRQSALAHNQDDVSNDYLIHLQDFVLVCVISFTDPAQKAWAC